jgi:hypothetical protein
MTSLITHIDKCLLKWILFNTDRRYKWHCCLLFFGVTNNRVYNDAFRTFTFQCSKVYRLHDQTNQDNSFNFRSTIEKPTCKLGENSSFSFFFFLEKNRNTGFSSRHLLRLQRCVWLAACKHTNTSYHKLLLIN